MAIRERTVEHHLVKAMERIGCQCIKFQPDNMTGMPDRLVLLPEGKVVWCEVKKPSGGVLSEIQRYQHQKLRALGHRVEVIWTVEDADRLADELALQGQM